MIIQLIGDGFYNLISTFFNFTIPSISADIIYDFYDFMAYLEYGIDIYCFFVPPFANYILTIVLVIKVSVDLYFLAMWILRKIPMLNIG